MASSSRGASCTKPSKGVFRTQLFIQDGAFAKIVNGFKYFRKKARFQMFDWALNMPLLSILKSPRNCPKFCINLLLYFFEKIVALKAASYSNPVSNFKHL